ncbi:MAG: phage holin family protein [Ruminococcus sp.]|nr:phage holin family protein [Ruminococcus sp.]
MKKDSKNPKTNQTKEKQNKIRKNKSYYIKKGKEIFFNAYSEILSHYVNGSRYYLKLIKKYQKNKNENNTIKKDDDPGKLITDGITNRDVYYTNLLKNYQKLTEVRNILKEIHKWLFFWIIVFVALWVIVFLFNYINNLLSLKIKNNDFTITTVTAIVSLISTILSIPLIITKYLFNNKEDDNITTIISKTQEHDNIQIKLLEERFSKRNKNEKNELKKESVNKLKEEVISKENT